MAIISVQTGVSQGEPVANPRSDHHADQIWYHARNCRHDRRVCQPEIFKAAHLSVLINNSIRIAISSHRRGAECMVEGGEILQDVLPQECVLDATGHCPNLSAPDEVTAAIRAFV